MKLWALMALTLALASAAHAQGLGPTRYKLELAVTWSAASHPHEFPPGAHFSDLFGVTHDARYVLFADGATASSGLELLAENGRGSILRAEFAEATRRRRVGVVFDGAGIGTVPGPMSASFEATPEHHLVSFVTMIAPSPDWFTGLAGVELMVDGKWIDRLELPLWAWDAGTDSGRSYADPDADTQPRESVRLLTTPHFLDAGGLKKVGTATITRVD